MSFVGNSPYAKALPAGDIVGTTDTQTLTNKTITDPSNTVYANAGPSGSAFGFRNKIINGGFSINQRAYVSGAAVGAGLYGHDRWKMAASGDTYTYSTTNNKTTITIPATKVLQQVIEGLNLQTGTYCLSWEGTAQGKIGAGSYGASGITGSITGGTNATIEFGPGTVANIQLEAGSVATPFETRPYGTELALCQRYYEKSYNVDVVPGTITYVGASLDTSAGTSIGIGHPFKVTKRATPTMTYYNAVTGAAGSFRDYSNSADRTVADWVTGASAWAAELTSVADNSKIFGHYVASSEL